MDNCPVCGSETHSSEQHDVGRLVRYTCGAEKFINSDNVDTWPVGCPHAHRIAIEQGEELKVKDGLIEILKDDGAKLQQQIERLKGEVDETRQLSELPPKYLNDCTPESGKVWDMIKENEETHDKILPGASTPESGVKTDETLAGKAIAWKKHQSKASNPAEEG